MKNFLLVLTLHFTLFTFNAYAWLNKEDKGTAGAQFLKIGLGAAGPAMGGAYTALSSDISGLYWNPGGLAFSECKEVEVMNLTWFEDTALQYLAYAMPFAKGQLGIHYAGLSVSELEERTGDTDDPLDTFNAQDQSIGLTYAVKSGDSAGMGATVKMVSSEIGDKSASAAALDLGYRKDGEKYLWGASLRNLGGGIKFETESDPLPTNLNLGAGIKLSPAMLLSLDLNLPNDNEMNFSVGYEYRLKASGLEIPLRLGYKTLNDFDTADALSVGIGFAMCRACSNVLNHTQHAFSLDLAWVPYGDLGDTIRIALKGKF